MSDQHELFTRRDDEHWLTEKAEYIRGLEGLSDYTLSQLPHDLRGIKDGSLSYDELVERQRPVLEDAAAAIYSNRDVDKAKLAQLDLLFMLGGYLPAGAGPYKGKHGFLVAPTHLLGLIEYQSKRFGLPRYMSYEMIVDVNVDEFMRTGNIRLYSDGEEAYGERDFYIGHYYAEPHIKEATWLLRGLLATPSSADTTDALQKIASHAGDFTRDVVEYGRLSRAGFAYFRDFLGSYPDGTRNASGAFMPTPQLFELALHKPTETQVAFLQESLPYYPTWAQPLVREWMQQSLDGYNIVDAVSSGRLPVDHDQMQILIRIAENFRDFKLRHLGVTHHQIPKAFPEPGQGLALSAAQLSDFGERDVFEPGAVPGTGGFNVQNVLGNGVYRLMQLVQELHDIDRQLFPRMFPNAVVSEQPNSLVPAQRRRRLGVLGLLRPRKPRE